MSQRSNYYNSSLYEDDTAILTPIPTLTDALSTSYPDSDGLIPFLHEPFMSQPSLTSAPEFNFSQLPSIPLILTRVKPDRRTEFVLFDAMNKEVFVNWWLQTTYGKKPKGKGFVWDRAGHLSDVWKHFDQLASTSDGLPKVRCQRCYKILDHPGQTKQGTNSMGRHWKGEKCQRASNQSQQPNIRRLLHDEVSNGL